MKIKINMNHNSLDKHNAGPISLTIPDNYEVIPYRSMWSDEDSDGTPLTPEQVEIVEKHFCPVAGCNCGSTGPLVKLSDGRIGVSTYWITGTNKRIERYKSLAKMYNVDVRQIGIALDNYVCSESGKSADKYLDDYFGFTPQKNEDESAIIACENGQMPGAMPADI